MRRPSTTFLLLGGIMIVLFVVGLILIAVLVTRNNQHDNLELTATSLVPVISPTLEFQLAGTQTQAAVLEAQTLTAATPTVASP